MTLRLFRIFSILVIVSLLVVACGKDEKGDGANEADDTHEFRVGGMSPEDNPITIALQDYADRIEDETDGRITFDIYPANELGDYTSMYDEVIKGTIDMGLFSLPNELDDRNAIDALPYLVTNYDQVPDMYGVDAYAYNKMAELMDEQGVHMLGIRTLGFAGVGSSKEITDPAETTSDKDLLVRVPQNKIYQKYAESMGFSTVSIPYADIFSAIQTGTADGIIGAQPAASYLSFRDVIENYYQYNYSFEAMPLMINQDIWEDLSDEDQEIMEKAGEDFTERAFEEAKEIDEEYLEEMKEEGINVVEFSDEELEAFAEHARNEVWPYARETLGEDIVDELLEEVK